MLLLVTAGGAILGLAAWEKTTLTWAAQESSYAAATAGAEDAACLAALAVAPAAAGRTAGEWTDCTGSDGLTMHYNEPPGMVTIILAGSRWDPPFLPPITIEATAAAVIRHE